VDSQPPGADVTLNGDFRGITPLDLTSLPLGAYEVRMELKGFEPRTQSVSLTADVPQSQVRASLSRLGPAMGSAAIESTPMGASVTIDGARAGVTPLPDYKVKVGNHRVDIAMEGYESWSGNLVVQSGSKGSVDAQLRPIPKPAATPAPTPTAEAADPNRAYVEPELDAQLRKLSGPSTPQPRLKPGESLSVSVDIVVLESGDVSEARVDEASGNKSLDDAVLAMVRGSKYTPPAKRGAKVKARIRRKFTFKSG
jgi:TonB family protein